MVAKKANLLRFSEAAPRIDTADLLLFKRPAQWYWQASKAISIVGRNEHTHAGMAIRHGANHPILLCSEVIEFHGGRAVSLERLVRAEPGRIDVYKIHPQWLELFDAEKAANTMLQLAGEPYGWGAIARASVSHLPIVRWFTEMDYDRESQPGVPNFCSDAVSFALRAGGLDPVPGLADCFTEPGDLARSAVLEYFCTLVPDEEPR